MCYYLRMNLIYIILNIVQGITEFLPISSSGHLLIIEHISKVQPGEIEAFLHFPTVISILIVFFYQLLEIAKNPKEWPKILAAIIPAGLIGFIFKDYIELIFYSPLVVAVNQIFWGVVMVWLVHNVSQKVEYDPNFSSKDVSVKQSLFIGMAQILALIPGTSRSGITTMAGIKSGLSAQDSAKYSFIIGFPLTAAAALLAVKDIVQNNTLSHLDISIWALVGGTIISVVVGVFAMRLFASKETLRVMKFSGFYRIFIGIFILLWLL